MGSPQRGWVEELVSILRESVEDLCSIRDERIFQNLLEVKLRRAGLNFEKRVVLRSRDRPDLEVDLYHPGGMAVEVKLDPRFYQGIGQVLSARELYGLDAVLLQVWEEVDERTLRALSRLAERLSLSIVLVERRRRAVRVVGRVG